LIALACVELFLVCLFVILVLLNVGTDTPEGYRFTPCCICQSFALAEERLLCLFLLFAHSLPYERKTIYEKQKKIAFTCRKNLYSVEEKNNNPSPGKKML
jgi:hypothetical protein